MTPTDDRIRAALTACLDVIEHLSHSWNGDGTHPNEAATLARAALAAQEPRGTEMTDSPNGQALKPDDRANAAPPKWMVLTDEQIDEIWNRSSEAWGNTIGGPSLETVFARAIERALSAHTRAERLEAVLLELVAADEQLAAAKHKTASPYWDYVPGANADDTDPVGTAQKRYTVAWAAARAVSKE